MPFILHASLIYLTATGVATALFVAVATLIKRSKRALSVDDFADMPLTTD